MEKITKNIGSINPECLCRPRQEGSTSYSSSGVHKQIFVVFNHEHLIIVKHRLNNVHYLDVFVMHRSVNASTNRTVCTIRNGTGILVLVYSRYEHLVSFAFVHAAGAC